MRFLSRSLAVPALFLWIALWGNTALASTIYLESAASIVYPLTGGALPVAPLANDAPADSLISGYFSAEGLVLNTFSLAAILQTFSIDPSQIGSNGVVFTTSAPAAHLVAVATPEPSAFVIGCVGLSALLLCVRTKRAVRASKDRFCLSLPHFLLLGRLFRTSL